VYTGQVAAVAFLRCCHFMICNDNINMSHAAVCRIFWNHFGELLNSFNVFLACFLSLVSLSLSLVSLYFIIECTAYYEFVFLSPFLYLCIVRACVRMF